MTTKEDRLKVLFLEDIPTDVEIAVRELRKQEIEFIYKVAEDRLSFEEMLVSFNPDLIISDFMLPTINGLEALRISLDTNPDIPVIILTGSMNEETAVACMKAGAADYVVKDFIVKLPFAVKEALDKRKAVSDLQQKTFELNTYFDNALDLFCIASKEGYFLRLNKTWEQTLGYSLSDLEGARFLDFIHPDDIKKTMDVIGRLEDNEEVLNFVNRYRCKDGEYKFIEWRSRTEGDLIYAAARDITERVETELKLQIEKDKYRLLFISNPLPMWVYEVETLRFVTVNNSAVEKYGYTQEEFASMTIKDIRPAEDVEMLISNVQNSSDNYERTSGWRHMLKDGTIIYVEVVSHGLEFDGMRCRMVMANDITQRVKDEQLRGEMMAELQNSEERYRKFFEEDLTADYISTHTGELIECNEAYVKMFGFRDREHALKTRATELYENPEDREAYIRLIQEKGGVERHEITYRSLQGAQIHCILNSFGHFDADGNLQRIQGYIFDITDIKKAALEMKEARELAERSNKLKDAFIANISHEIRTPMNAIIGFSGIIKESFSSNDDKELADYFNVIDEAGARLMRTVDLILSLSKLQAGVMETKKSKIDPEKEITKIITHHRIASEKKGLPVSLINNSGIKELVTDEYCFTEVLSNFIDNAIKYTEKGEVRVVMELRRGGDLAINVIDTGIGIEKQFQDKLFQPFVQEETGYSRSYDGVGLGLSIVKRFAELSGYGIEVESDKGKGSRFSLIIPEKLFNEKREREKTAASDNSNKSTPASIGTAESKDSRSEKPLIYAVEDDEDSQVYITTILSGKYNIELAATDKELFIMLENKLPRVILMDISLRGSRDGLAITKELKTDKRYCEIPVIAVTAHAFQSDRINAQEAGCAGFLSKPYSPGDLFKLISAALIKG